MFCVYISANKLINFQKYYFFLNLHFISSKKK